MQVRVEHGQSSPHTEWVEARAISSLSVVGISPRRCTESAVDAPTNRGLMLIQHGCPQSLFVPISSVPCARLVQLCQSLYQHVVGKLVEQPWNGRGPA